MKSVKTSGSFNLEQVNMTLDICIYMIFAFYFVLFMLLSYNTVKFMIKQRRYLYYQLTCFYVLAFLIVIFRVAFFSFVLYIVHFNEESTSPEVTQRLQNTVSSLDMVATYLELALGIQQCNSMMDLLLKLKETLEA